MTNLRFTANMALMAKVQAAAGVAETTMTAANAILLVEPAKVVAQPINIDRKLVRPYWGASEQVQGAILTKLTFKVELGMASGPGIVPAVGALLRGCAFAETVVADSRVEYSPVSQVTEILTFHFFQDGVRYITRDARGRCKLMLNAYEVPMAEFEFWGIGRQPAEVALPATDFSGTVTPLAISAPNSSYILGSTLTAGSITGGTGYPCKGLEVEVANDLQHYLNTQREEVGIANRKITGKTSVLLTEAQELAWYTDIAALTTTTASFVHGPAAGRRLIVHGPKVQRADMDREDDRGRVNFATNLVYLPSAGNDDLKLIFK